MNLTKGKKLVFWGAGTIANICLKQFPKVRPQFFIDSSWNNENKFCDITVIRPDEVDGWDELFVVTMVSSAAALEEIENILKKRGLKKEKDYIGFGDFFGYHKKNIAESITYIKNFIRDRKDYKNCTLIVAPVFASRTADIMLNFFRMYGQKKVFGKCVLFSSLNIMDEDYAEEQIGFPVLDMPQICKWSGRKDQNILDLEGESNHVIELSDDECKYIKDLEQRKISENNELSFRVSAEMYWYLKQILTILQPREVIIWSGWSRLSFILAEISGRNSIPYGFMEFGWIPGTFQFDRRGVGGQCEYAVYPEKILNIPITNKDMDVKAIREYIRKTQLDNRKFRINDLDESNFSHVDRCRKTVFFVGMADSIMEMNPQSGYWSEYISSHFHSTLDAVLYVAEICERNQWNFVFKPHPSTVKDTGINPDCLPENIIFIKDMQIDRLIEAADVVISIASAVDYKALIYGRPLVSLGHTTLHKKGCCYEPKDKKDIESQLIMAVNNGMTEEQNENFEQLMIRLLENYLWDDLSERDLRYGLSLETDFFARN